jgi:hypothetical protein
VDFGSLSAMYGDAAVKCSSTGAVEAANFVAVDAWSWPGSFDFNALDAALSDFFACANAAAVSVSIYKHNTILVIYQKLHTSSILSHNSKVHTIKYYTVRGFTVLHNLSVIIIS